MNRLGGALCDMDSGGSKKPYSTWDPDLGHFGVILGHVDLPAIDLVSTLFAEAAVGSRLTQPS